MYIVYGILVLKLHSIHCIYCKLSNAVQMYVCMYQAASIFVTGLRLYMYTFFRYRFRYRFLSIRTINQIKIKILIRHHLPVQITMDINGISENDQMFWGGYKRKFKIKKICNMLQCIFNQYLFLTLFFSQKSNLVLPVRSKSNV